MEIRDDLPAPAKSLKSAVSDQLSRLRASHNLLKAARGFEHKLSSNEVTPKESADMCQAQQAFQANPIVKDVQLPWCMMALKQYAQYKFSFGDPVHPKTTFPEAAMFLSGLIVDGICVVV